MRKNKILLDSSFLIAFFNPKDTLTEKAVKIMQNRGQEDIELVIHPLVIIETLTVLKMKTNLDDMRKYGNVLFGGIFTVINSFDLDYKKGRWLSIFNRNNGLSVVDCILLDYSLKNKIELLTFDEKLKKEYKANRK